MLETAIISTRRFLMGKLFNDNWVMVRQLAIGVSAGVVAMVVVGLVAPLWLASIGGGLVTGFLQPLLFKDLKYA